MKDALTFVCKRGVLTGIAMGFAAIIAAPARTAAGPVADCPLARTPYSTYTPILDLLLDSPANSMLEASSLLEKVPPFVLRTTPPSLASILSLRVASHIVALYPAAVENVETRLAALPIRPEDSIARCARYEADRKEPLAVPAGRPAMLIFDRSNGYRDGPSVEAATEALRAIGQRPANYRDPNNVRMIEQGIAWTMGLEPSGCRRDGLMSSSLSGTQ